MIGQTISHYKILEKLGEGGMGVVYKAQDTKLLRPVALKFLTPDMTRDQDAKKRFIQEARAASALDHPNIAVVHDVDETADGHSFICMAYYEGQTLKTKFTKGSLGIDEAIHLILQIASGLQRAHESGIVHRDIKPGNIIITSKGDVKIVDFGLAKLSAQTRESRTLITGGTAAYMAPEQILGSEADARCDLFSLGVVFYEAVAGRRPFAGEHEAALFYSIVNAEPAPPSTIRPEIPQELERIILKLLEKDPEKRYQYAADVRDDLKHFLGERPTPRPVRQFRKAWRAKYSAPVAVAAALFIAFVILVAVGVIELWTGGPELPQQVNLAVMKFRTNDSTRNFLSDGVYESLINRISAFRTVRKDFNVIVSVDARTIETVRDAYRNYGATIALTSFIQWEASSVHVTMNLVDAKTSYTLSTEIVSGQTDKIRQLEEELLQKVAAMMKIEIRSSEFLALNTGNTQDEKAFAHYVQARGLLADYRRREKLDSAITLLRRAVAQDPRYVLAYAALGEAYWRKYETSKDTQWVNAGIAACTTGMNLDDRIAPLHAVLGMIYRGTTHHAEAIKSFERAISIDSLTADMYRELGVTFAAVGDSTKALASFQKAIALQPNDWKNYNSLGGFYYRRERYDNAIANWKKVLELAPVNSAGYGNLGAAFFMLGRWTEAIEVFELSLQKAPDENYPAHANLGTMFYYDGQYSRSAQAYETALNIKRNEYQVWGSLGSAYRAMGSNKLAQEASEKAVALGEAELRIRPREPSLLTTLGGYYADLGRKAEADSLLKQALRLAPNDSRIQIRAGMMYELLGKRQMALGLIAQAAKKGAATIEIKYSPEMKSLREDPRYKQLTEGGRTGRR